MAAAIIWSASVANLTFVGFVLDPGSHMGPHGKSFIFGITWVFTISLGPWESHGDMGLHDVLNLGSHLSLCEKSWTLGVTWIFIVSLRP